MDLFNTVAMGAWLLHALTKRCCCLCRTSKWDLVLAVQSCQQQTDYQILAACFMLVAAAPW